MKNSFACLLVTTTLLIAVTGCGQPGPGLPADVLAGIRAGATEPGPATAVTPEPPMQPRRMNVDAFETWTVRETAMDALGRMGSAAVPPLVNQLQNPDPAIRLRAATVLARLGPDAATAAAPLAQATNDPDPRVQKMAVYALGQIGPDAAAAIPELMRFVDEPGDVNRP